MKKNLREMLTTNLQMDEEDLLLEIGRQEQPAVTLHSPASLKRKAQKTLKHLLPRIRKNICKQKDLHNLPEFALAMEIVAVISQSVPIGVACAVAAYLAKRGFEVLCSEENGDE